MRKQVILIFLLLFSFNFNFAERVIYQEIKKWSVKNDHYIVTHFHDWSTFADKKREKVVYVLQNPFSQEENDYAYIECRETKSNVLIFKIPSIALTYIYLSPLSKYIIGLSKIKVDNPYQMIVLNFKGELILKKHIAVEEAFLSNEEFKQFKKDHPESFRILNELKGISYRSNGVYIDFLRMNMHKILGNTWDYLFTKIKRSNLSGNFWETTTNYINWYKEPDPKIKIICDNQILKAISLLDPSGKRFEIPIEEKEAEN